MVFFPPENCFYSISSQPATRLNKCIYPKIFCMQNPCTFRASFPCQELFTLKHPAFTHYPCLTTRVKVPGQSDNMTPLQPDNQQNCTLQILCSCTVRNGAYAWADHTHLHTILHSVEKFRVKTRDGHRHLQIGRMLDIDLISEPLPPQMYVSKCGNLCGQRGRKRFIASWGLRMSHIGPCTPCPSPQGIGQRSKVIILPASGKNTAKSRNHISTLNFMLSSLPSIFIGSFLQQICHN